MTPYECLRGASRREALNYHDLATDDKVSTGPGSVLSLTLKLVRKGLKFDEWVKSVFPSGSSVVLGARGSQERRICLKAVMGYVSLNGEPRALAYSYERLVEAHARMLAAHLGRTRPADEDYEDAMDHVSYNTIRAVEYEGGWRKGLPVILVEDGE